MQAIRFGAVGGVNTLIDFGILNLLMWMTGITGGSGLVLCNVAAFAAASLNSYLMNKGWTFKDESRGTPEQYFLFLAFSVGGLAVNSGVLYVLTALPLDGTLSPILWANGAKACATIASMVWNFLTYRRFVFPRDGRRGAIWKMKGRRLRGNHPSRPPLNNGEGKIFIPPT